jgi:hypothetical protein
VLHGICIIFSLGFFSICVVFFYFMSPAVFNVDVMRCIVLFFSYFFGIISCNSYAHLEDTTQEFSRRICSFFCYDVHVSSYSEACS